MKHLTHSDGRVELQGEPEELQKFLKKGKQTRIVTSVKKRSTRGKCPFGKKQWSKPEEKILAECISGLQRIPSKKIAKLLVREGHPRRTTGAIDARIYEIRKNRRTKQ